MRRLRQAAGRLRRRARISGRTALSRLPAPPAAGAAADPNRRKVVGLAGFFGDGNYGDELFLEVFKQYLGPQFELRVIADLSNPPFFSRPVEEIVAELDAIVIGGGDILQPWNQDPRYFNHAFLAKPVFVVGVGVPQYSGANARPEREPIIRRHRRFMHHPNVRRIGVRDDQAAQWIRKWLEPPLEVLVAPDIVCSLDLPEAVRPEGAPILGLVTRLRSGIAVPDDYTQLKRLAHHATDEGWRIRHIVLGTGVVGVRDRENADTLEIEGKEIVYSEELDDLSRAIGECTVLASMKFHGTVVATMYGVPSIVLVPTNKNVNFMRRIGLDALVARFESPKLVETFDARPEVNPADVTRIRAQAEEHMRDLVDAVIEAVAVAAPAR